MTIAKFIRCFAVLFLFITLNSSGQIKLKGTYCTKPDFTGFYLTFKRGNLFEYTSWGCTGGSTGRGSYDVKGEKLILNFVSDDTLKNSFSLKDVSSFSVKDTPCDKADSVQLDFEIIYAGKNEAVPFASVILRDSSTTIKETLSDFDGLATLKLERMNKEFEAYVSCVGYKPSSIKLMVDGCKSIRCNLKAGFIELNGEVENGTKWEYRIKEADSKRLVLLEDSMDVIMTRTKKIR